MRRTAREMALRGLLVIACLIPSYTLGAYLKDVARGPFLRETQGLDPRERSQLMAKVETALSNAAWAAGDKATAHWFIDRELIHAPESLAIDDPVVARRRVRALLRLTALSTNPEGQSAILNNACAIENDLCQGDTLLHRVKSETDRRLVPPGNQLPPFFLGNQHPSGACEY